MIGHGGSLLARRVGGRVNTLKPAEIADLLEEATKEEGGEILIASATTLSSRPTYSRNSIRRRPASCSKTCPTAMSRLSSAACARTMRQMPFSTCVSPAVARF